MQINQDSVEIMKTLNDGYIVKHRYTDADDEGREVFRDDVQAISSDVSDEKAFINMIYTIADIFGFYYDKYKENNLNVTFNKKGHKYSEDDTDAKVCDK